MVHIYGVYNFNQLTMQNFFKVEDLRISAHKIILAGAIPYFLAMFTSDMMEENLKEIEIRGIDGP